MMTIGVGQEEVRSVARGAARSTALRKGTWARWRPSILWVGRFLRRYSLDELPQLFNVLKGQMSLVGPRMITPAELRHFRRWRHNLWTVKPGLTGLWQVNGRSDLSYEGRVRMDMQYIRNYTIWQDLKLLFDAVWAVVKGQGTY